jgi:hypothetical protein
MAFPDLFRGAFLRSALQLIGLLTAVLATHHGHLLFPFDISFRQGLDADDSGGGRVFDPFKELGGQVPDGLFIHGIMGPIAPFFPPDESRLPQDLQVLRGRGLGYTQPGG